MKKLLLDACTKTSFMSGNKRESMGSPFVPVLSNTIMTELEEKSIRKFVEDSTIKFYGYFVNDTLLVSKPKVIG